MRNREALSRKFILQQRKRLETLRDQLVAMDRDTSSEERTSQSDHADEPRDSGDISANIAQGEIDQALLDVNERRLRDVERALEKIREGSYGLSETSGKPIPKVRLEAVPEAVKLAEEEQGT
jgi:RNA polymerase-binding transcription factor